MTLLVGLALWSVPLWLLDRIAGWHPGCLFRMPTHHRVLALTIDDGPDPSSTPAILDQLRRHGARATFFLIAGQVAGREHLVRRIVAEGHEIGNHFWRDRPGIRLGLGEFENDLLRSHQALARHGPVRWARPGSGWYSGPMVAVMRRHGYRCALGSVYPYDAALSSTAFSVDHILRRARPGSIVILHDGGARGRRTAEVLRRTLPTLARRGYQAVTLSALARVASAGRR